MFQMEFDCACEHSAFCVLALRDLIFNCVGMVNDLDVLRDNWSFVQVRRDIMRGGTNHFDAPFIGPMIGLCALEPGQEAVVNVDDAAIELAAKLVGQDLHVAREDNEIDLLLFNHRKQFCLLVQLCFWRDRQIVKRNALMLCPTLPAHMIGNDARHIHWQPRGRGPVQKIVQAVPALAYHDHCAQFLAQVVYLPV